jgi:hypothetical protein
MPDSGSTTLHSRVQRWVEGQGYPLEMRVAQTFEQAGFEVSQSQKYLDPGTDELREIDVVASLNRQYDAITIATTLFIECKYSEDEPWVVFTSSRHLDPLSYFSRILRDKYNVYEWQSEKSLQGRLTAKILASLPRDNPNFDFDFFRVPPNVGYSVVQALGKPGAKDNAYIATMQANSCVEANDFEVERGYQESIQDYERRVELIRKSKFSVYCNIGFPIVVLQGHLFECHLDSKNEIAVSEISEGIVILGSKDRGEELRARPSTSAVRIVTETSLQSVAQKAYQAADLLLAQEQAVRELYEYEFHQHEKIDLEKPPF